MQQAEVMMRLGSLLPGLAFVFVASGCVSASWSIDRHGARSLSAVAVAAVELAGDAEPKLADTGRDGLIDSLRARGYAVEDERPGVPLLKIRLSGKRVSDDQMHAPDDRRHNMTNDLHYSFVVYHVELELVDGANIVARGSANSDIDPAAALRVLSQRLFSDVPPRGGDALASR
jgi:hypothetical protein